MKPGRPKEDLSTLPDGWQAFIINLYSEGGSDVEVKALIHSWRDTFSNDLWSRWMEEEPDFSKTIKRGRELCAAWWEHIGRKNLKDREFSYTGWYMNMKNRFGWADNQKTDITTGGDKITLNITSNDAKL